MYNRDMMLRFSLIFAFILLFVLGPHLPVWGAEVPNNKFGIHITDIHEAQKAADLVNSNGGQWGYVTLMINSNDRKVDKWQERMNTLNELKLIPIVRINTYPNGDTWTKPVVDDANDWANFLNSLYWPTKERIVSIYNEPNHGSEWSGSTNPQEYAQVMDATITELKKRNPNFFVLNAGFDASTPQQPPEYMDQVSFMDAMDKAVPGIFSKLDGWSSHSYPNPGFSGKPSDTGRGSIQTYKWELDLLRSRYKVQKELPVYITETGWATKNADHSSLKYDEEAVRSNIEYAFNSVWLPDERVRAVVPFLLAYKEPLFSHFSWIKPDGSETLQYSWIKGMSKVAGEPARENRSAITSVSVPYQIQQGIESPGTISFKNTGNTIWSVRESFMLTSIDDKKLISRQNFDIEEKVKVNPGQSYVFRFTLFTDTIEERVPVSFQMQQYETLFGERVYVPIKIFRPPKVTVQAANNGGQPIQNVLLSFRSGNEQVSLDKQTVSASGTVGTYTNTLFKPKNSLTVALQTPNRDEASKTVLLGEGENIVTIELPALKPFWQRWFQ